MILIASGSEVGLIVAAAERLQAEGIAVRCVSMPCWELFDAQPQIDRDEVLPPSLPLRLAVELGVSQGWQRLMDLSAIPGSLDLAQGAFGTIG